MGMYRDTAPLYDLLHGFKDYRKEADHLRRLVRERMPHARTLLDVACGTGNHIAGLRQDFVVEGLDQSPEMLAQARLKFPALRFHQASMTDFELGRRFDIVCCLYSSIAAARTPDGLRAAIRTMARHVEPGGLLFVEPFFTPETFWVGHVKLHELRTSTVTVSWMHVSDRQGDIGIYRNHYLIGQPGGIDHFTEDHELGLFRAADFERAFNEAALALELDTGWPSGLGVYVGSKPA